VGGSGCLGIRNFCEQLKIINHLISLSILYQLRI
jgi:hypothetical protein